MELQLHYHFFNNIQFMIKLIRRSFSVIEGIPKSITLKGDFNQNNHLALSQTISSDQLARTIQLCLKQQQKALWVHLNQQNLNHIQMLISKFNFKIHHGLNNKVSLYRWQSQLSDMVPPYSMFYISCGGIIIKDDHIFLIEENNGARKGEFGIPGGRADFGQTIPNCAERQLRQQTGIQAKFKYLLHIRQLDKTTFNGSDIYFACMMEANQQTLKNIQICPRQLASYKWVHLSQYADFMQTRSRGTQKFLAQYIHKLYTQGFDFKNRIPNQKKQKIYDSYKDHIVRKFVQHMLVQQKIQTISDKKSK